VLTREIPPIEVRHSPEITEKLEVFLQSQKDGRYLSPSAINTYVDCSLKFYLRYLAGIGESEEVEEEIGAAGFGTVVHDTLHILYSRIAERNQHQITVEELSGLLPTGEAERVLRETFMNHHFRGRKTGRLEGRNIIMFQVMLRYLKKIIQTDLPLAPFQLISAENTFKREMEISLADRKARVRLGGKIDRVDKLGELIRVIDYKTGGAKLDFPSLESLFDSEHRNRNSAALQTLLYAWLVEADHPGEKILPGLYVMKALFGEDFDPALLMTGPVSKGRIETFSVVEKEYVERLKGILQTLFDPAIPFTQRANDQRCTYCDFAELCSRNSIE
jgi:CRISPR/Cas system-associated exonuclease Cas4 (RecB family)